MFFANTKKGVKSVFVFETEQTIFPVLNTEEFESLTWANQKEWELYWNNDITVDYEKHNFYAIDLDNTILEDKYPLLGDFLPNAVENLKKIVKDSANHIIIWTMRDSSQHAEIKNLFEQKGIRILGINEHLTQHEWTDSAKLYADFFIDDRNLNMPKKHNKIIWNHE